MKVKIDDINAVTLPNNFQRFVAGLYNTVDGVFATVGIKREAIVCPRNARIREHGFGLEEREEMPFFGKRIHCNRLASPNGRFLRHRPERSERRLNCEKSYQGQPALPNREGVPEGPQRKNHVSRRCCQRDKGPVKIVLRHQERRGN